MSQATNGLVAVRDDTELLVELLHVIAHDLVKVVLHDVDLVVELSNLLLEVQVLVLTLCVLLLCVSNLDLQIFTLLAQVGTLTSQLVGTIRQSLDNLGLLLVETVLHVALLRDDSFGATNFRVGVRFLRLDVINDEALAVADHEVALVQKLLLSVANLLHLTLLEVCLLNFTLQDGNDVLDAVDLVVEAVSLASGGSEALQELDALHFRLVYQVHVLILFLDELHLELSRVFIAGVDLCKVPIVVSLKLLTMLLNLLALHVKLGELLRAHLTLEVKSLPLLIDLTIQRFTGLHFFVFLLYKKFVQTVFYMTS